MYLRFYHAMGLFVFNVLAHVNCRVSCMQVNFLLSSDHVTPVLHLEPVDVIRKLCSRC